MCDSYVGPEGAESKASADGEDLEAGAPQTTNMTEKLLELDLSLGGAFVGRMAMEVVIRTVGEEVELPPAPSPQDHGEVLKH